MSTLTITGQFVDPAGGNVSVLVYDDQNNLVYSDTQLNNFQEIPNLNPGTYSLDIFGYTQSDFNLSINGYQSINPIPPSKFFQRVSGMFNVVMN